jgi:hypothetical protein
VRNFPSAMTLTGMSAHGSRASAAQNGAILLDRVDAGARSAPDIVEEVLVQWGRWDGCVSLCPDNLCHLVPYFVRSIFDDAHKVIWNRAPLEQLL